MTAEDLDSIEREAKEGVALYSGATLQLVALCRQQQARLQRFDDTWPDAVLCAEWVAAVALPSSDVYQAAKRYLIGQGGELRREKAFEIVEAELRERAPDYDLQIRSNIYLYPAFDAERPDTQGQTLMQAVDALKGEVKR